MKKIIALALAILMMAAIAVPAMADKTLEVGADEATTLVTFGVTDRYTVTVPSAVAFGTELSKTATISATDVVVAGNKQLQVKIASAVEYDYDGEGTNAAAPKTAWTLVETSQNGSDAVSYKVALAADTQEETATALVNNDVVLSAISQEADDETKTVTLYFSTPGTTQSGNYADILTFTTAVVDYTPPQQAE